MLIRRKEEGRAGKGREGEVERRAEQNRAKRGGGDEGQAKEKEDLMKTKERRRREARVWKGRGGVCL